MVFKLSLQGYPEAKLAGNIHDLKKMKKDRFKLIPTCHLFLIKDDEILLSRRFNTGYMDGYYSFVAGHFDGEETAKKAMAREAKEEIGIDIKENDLLFATVMHRKSNDERVDFFFLAKKWSGEIENKEPRKCDDLIWRKFDNLPENVIPYIRKAIENYQSGLFFDQFGWD